MVINHLVIYKISRVEPEDYNRRQNHIIPGGLRSYDLLGGEAMDLPLGDKAISACLSLNAVGRLKPRLTTGGIRVLTLVPRIERLYGTVRPQGAWEPCIGIRQGRNSPRPPYFPLPICRGLDSLALTLT